MAHTLVLQGRTINGIEDLYAEINRVFMAGESWQLGASLDALDDLLYGGYGVLQGEPHALLIWRDMAHSRQALGTACTCAWLQAKMEGGQPFNRTLIQAQLDALQQGKGQTYFEIVMDIFAAHSNITLRAD